MTYRERRERRAERLRGWAEKREGKAEAAHERAHELGQMIPLGQPIMVGHHSERGHRADLKRIDNAMRASVENDAKAREMRERAANIEAQNKRAIYSDDADAAERLAERIAGLEAERGRVKAYNASCRKGQPDTSLLDDAQRTELASCLRFQGYQCKGGRFPSYVLSNLGGNIGRLRKRLEALQSPAQTTGRWMDARFSSDCEACGHAIEKGARILYVRAERAAYCEPCGQA